MAKNFSRWNDDQFVYPSQKLISHSKPKATEVHRGSLPPKPTQPFQAKGHRGPQRFLATKTDTAIPSQKQMSTEVREPKTDTAIPNQLNRPLLG